MSHILGFRLTLVRRLTQELDQDSKWDAGVQIRPTFYTSLNSLAGVDSYPSDRPYGTTLAPEPSKDANGISLSLYAGPRPSVRDQRTILLKDGTEEKKPSGWILSGDAKLQSADRHTPV